MQYLLGMQQSAQQQYDTSLANYQPSRKTRVYVIGALKNPDVVCLANELESGGYDVFADWYSPGPEADQFWCDYEKARGHTYAQALDGPHAWNIFDFDKKWLNWCDVAVLVLPAGKSGHIELGYCIGAGKRGFILMDGEPERWDVMYRFAEKVCMTTEELLDALR